VRNASDEKLPKGAHRLLVRTHWAQRWAWSAASSIRLQTNSGQMMEKHDHPDRQYAQKAVKLGPVIQHGSLLRG